VTRRRAGTTAPNRMIPVSELHLAETPAEVLCRGSFAAVVPSSNSLATSLRGRRPSSVRHRGLLLVHGARLFQVIKGSRVAHEGRPGWVPVDHAFEDRVRMSN
jgi:hypothetical protein